MTNSASSIKPADRIRILTAGRQAKMALDGSSYSVESYSDGTILPFQVEVASSLRAFKYRA
jgi:hypothetical protein